MERQNQYQQWTETALNQRIFALYDQIEKVTLENLEVAQKNCELQIQIKTIDDVLQSLPLESSGISSSNCSEESIEFKYENLMQDHQKLAKRVHDIEEILYGNNNTKSSFSKSKNSRHCSSTQNFLSNTQRKSAMSKRSTGLGGFQTPLRREESSRRLKINR